MQKSAAFWASPGPLTRLSSKWDGVVASLPGDAEKIAKIVAHLCLVDVTALDMYGEELSDARRAEIHVRPAEAMLERLGELKAFTKLRGRPPRLRIVGRSRSFAVLAVALCRAKGIPARARAGFASYMSSDVQLEHWIFEYFDDQKWRRVDPSLDETWLSTVPLSSRSNLTRAHFLSGAEAWRKWRSDKAVDPDDFGLESGLTGPWFVAQNVIRDLVALNKLEMLPWDVWGTKMPEPETDLKKEDLAFFDSLAALANDPDGRLPELQERCRSDPAVAFQGGCFNAITEQLDELHLPPSDPTDAPPPPDHDDDAAEDYFGVE